MEKAVAAIGAGIHLLIIYLIPPSARDHQGIHPAIWHDFMHDDFTLPVDKPLTLVSYVGCPAPEAYIEPTAVNAPLKEMPLFLTHDIHVPVPLEATYQAAWEEVPDYCRGVLEQSSTY